MIPLSLSIQGIYSYQTRQTIDFTKLTGAGIFGIFGPVGSGKSTILEAITFALYGRTDRLNLSGDNRNYNMMNLKSNEMLIEFVFKAGAEQAEYKALVKSRRNTRQFDDVKSCERTAYKKSGNDWIPFEIEKLESILGLSYDNFKRTVIIPQGKFQEFLLLGSKDRTLMMKELFNLDRFELYYKVAAMEGKTNEQKQNIEGQLQQLGEATNEQIEATGDILKRISQEIDVLVSELSLKQKEENHFKRIKEITEKIEGYQSQLKVLRQEENDILRLEKMLADYEYCLVHFKSLIDTVDGTGSNINNLRKSLADDENFLRENSERIQKLGNEFEIIRKEYEDREIIRQKAGELSKIVRIIDLQDRYKNFLIRISNGEKLVAETTSKLELQKQKQEEISKNLKALKEQSPDVARLSKAREWFTINTVLGKSLKELENEKAIIDNEINDLLQQRTSLFNLDCFSGISLTESYDRVIVLLDEKKSAHLSAIEVLNTEKQHIHVQQKLEEYATALEEGKPCPLCGSLSHPGKFNPENIAGSLLTLEKELSNHENSLNTIDKCLKKLTELNTAVCLKEDVLAKLTVKLKETQHQYTGHQELNIWDDIGNEEALNALFLKAEKLRKETSAFEKEIENLRILIEKESNQKEMYSKAIVELQKNSIKELSEANTLKEQITILNFEAYAGKNPELLTAESENLLKQFKVIEEQYQSLFDQLTRLRKDQDNLVGRMETNKNALNKEEQVLNATLGKIHEKILGSEYQSLDNVRKILAGNPDLEKERKKVTNYRQELDFVTKQLNLLQQEISDNHFDPEKYSRIQEDVKKLSLDLNFKNQEKGQMEATLLKLKTDHEKRENLQETYAKLSTRLEDIKTLKQLFKGNGFVKFISGVYLQELVNSANERFYKLSGQKLSLELNEENDFEIRDFMNGGKLRNIKTLSGGQTFQAALSLALALSDNTRKLSGAGENFFFLDEGFGSLDKDSLQVVFQTLKLLRHENRIVGIISHVEEMNQEIDVHLKITNSEDLGSVINKSWE